MYLKKFRELKEKLLHAKITPTPGPEEPKRKTWLDRFKEKFPGAHFVNTSLGGLNRPKYQPCPQCHVGSKRIEKTVGGARYQCQKHGAFLIRGKSQIQTH